MLFRGLAMLSRWPILTPPATNRHLPCNTPYNRLLDYTGFAGGNGENYHDEFFALRDVFGRSWPIHCHPNWKIGVPTITLCKRSMGCRLCPATFSRGYVELGRFGRCGLGRCS